MYSTSNYLNSTTNAYCKPFLSGFDSFTENTVFPLWSTKTMFNKEFLQVEVLADKEVPLEKRTDDIINMNSYTCHICNIEVPKSYMNEHVDGNKHTICLKIAELALERTRNHMNLRVKESRVHVADTYFCEPCAIVVQNHNKISHESSEQHMKSLKHDKFLEEFLMIYEDRDSIDFVARTELNGSEQVEDLLETDITINGMSNGSFYETVERIKTPEPPQIIKQIEKPQPEHISEAIETSKTESDQTSTDQKIQNISDTCGKVLRQISECLRHYPEHKSSVQIPQKSSPKLEKYLKTVAEKCTTTPIHSLEALSDKLVLITAINGDKIKVPLLNFHSIHNQKEKSYCKICEDPNVGYNHEYSEEHMEKVMIPIEDKNAMRKIDDIWSHCVLCNDLTKNMTFHLQSLLHRNRLKHCLVDSGTDINHNTRTPAKTQLNLEHGLIGTSHNNSEITCTICSVNIPNNDASIDNHIKTFDHILNYNTNIENNELTEIDDAQFYCTPCDMCVSKCYALGHCNGKKHNKNLTDFINKMTDVPEECTHVILPSISQQIKKNKKHGPKDWDLICFVCNIILHNVDKHMNSLDHKRSYLSYLESNKLNEIEEDTFFCIPCNTVILIDYLMSHCTGKKHKTHLSNLISNTQEINNMGTAQVLTQNTHISRSITQSVQNVQAMSQTEMVSQNGVFDTAIPLKFLYQFREMSNSRHLLCTICDDEIPFKKYDVQSHVNITDHVVAFNLLMLWNKIKILHDKYHCGVCNVDITYFSELTHVLSASHVEKMANIQKGTVYEYDKKLLTLEYAMSHKVGDRVRPSSLIAVAKPNST